MSSYLTTQEVADRLGISVFTIRRYIRAGKLRAVKLDGVYRLSREELAEFLKSREIGGTPHLPASSDAPASDPSAPHGANSAPTPSQPTQPHST
jgi:excisionase family DNA binding protein